MRVAFHKVCSFESLVLSTWYGGGGGDPTFVHYFLDYRGYVEKRSSNQIGNYYSITIAWNSIVFQCNYTAQ